MVVDESNELDLYDVVSSHELFELIIVIGAQPDNGERRPKIPVQRSICSFGRNFGLGPGSLTNCIVRL